MAIEQTTFDFVMNQLIGQLFGLEGLFALFILVLAFIIATSNGLDILSTVIILVPLMLGLVGASLVPQIWLALIILFVSFLWIYFGYKLIGVIK